MNKKRKPRPSRGSNRWTTAYQVWNVKAGRYIRRKDGKPFVFPNSRRK